MYLDRILKDGCDRHETVRNQLLFDGGLKKKKNGLFNTLDSLTNTKVAVKKTYLHVADKAGEWHCFYSLVENSFLSIQTSIYKQLVCHRFSVDKNPIIPS